MKKIGGMIMDWSKLGSRKFWATVAGFVVSVLSLFGVSNGNPENIIGLITAFGSVVTYLVVQGGIDRKKIVSPEKKAPDKSSTRNTKK